MPQFGLLGSYRCSCFPETYSTREHAANRSKYIMLRAPTTHFVMLAQAILYRGAGFDLVWPQFIAIWLIATILFALVLFRFRKSLAEMS